MPQGTQKGHTLGIDDILKLQGANRAAVSYAFLYAALKRTEISRSPVRDALDCLTPFLAPYLSSIAGNQVNLIKLQEYLNSTYGFEVPLYALEQLMPELAREGYADYNKVAKAYVARKATVPFEIARSEIETDYDQIASRLKAFAEKAGLTAPPSSKDWGVALLMFLKNKPDQAAERFTKVKGALVEPCALEARVCAAFLKELHETASDHFGKVVRIMMGVLIEEFIASIGEIGELKSDKRPNVYLDTSVLLRLLGCSGSILKTATVELLQYLQDLGMPVLYLGGNETEASNILSAIVFVKDSGKQLEGETAEAISNGEVSITDIRLLQNSFVDELAKKNVFAADNIEAQAQKQARWQIDERGFSNFLLSEANRLKRPYRVQNRENDASYLGTIMRLREGYQSRDLLECRHLFVTTNRLLAAAARKYVIANKMQGAQSCPPMLSVGQVATIAWLIKDRKLAPEKVGRDLLANCYAAVSPDADWFRHFREGYEKAAGPIKDDEMNQHAALAMQAARRIAKEESFGNSALVRELNMAEVLSKAGETAKRMMEDVREAGLAELEKEQAASRQRLQELTEAKELELRSARADHLAAQARLEAEKLSAAEAAAESAAGRARFAMLEKNRSRANALGRIIINIARIVWIFAFLIATIYVWYFQVLDISTIGTAIISFLLVLISTLGFMDMIGVPLTRSIIDFLERRVSAAIEEFLNS